MDIASTAKAAFCGSIWPSHGVQRAGNSRVTQHVGHSRNINSNIPTLLRLNSVGEVSSDINTATEPARSNKMTPKLGLAETNRGKSKMIDSINYWMPFGTNIFNFGGISSKMGLADNRTAGLSIPLIGDIFMGQNNRGNQVPEINSTTVPNIPRKSFPFSDNRMKKLPNWMDVPFQQAMMVNGFNHTLLENKYEKDMTSPWNKFYSDWKNCSFDSVASDSGNQCSKCETPRDSERKGQKRLLEDSTENPTGCVSGELSNKLQSLSLQNNFSMETTPVCNRSQLLTLKKGLDKESPKMTMQGEYKSEVDPSDRKPDSIPVNVVKSEVGYVTESITPILNSRSAAPPVTETCENMALNVKQCITDSGTPAVAQAYNMNRDIWLECPSYSVPSDIGDSNAHLGQSGDVCIVETTIDSNQSSSSLLQTKEKCKKAKRARPSSKKRRRRKAQQNGSSGFHISSSNTSYFEDQQKQKKCRFEMKGCTNKDQISSSEHDSQNDNSDKTSKSTMLPVSFILGVNEVGQSDAGSHTAYKVSMLIDSDESAFSEEDTDFDCDNFDVSYRCDFLPNSGDLFNPLNFTVSISVSPSTPESCPKSPFQNFSRLDSINASWALSCDSAEVKSNTSKKVSFAPEDKLETVHPMIAWNFAYQSARKGPWEEYARDRQRFQRRIHEAESLLCPILQSCHRAAVFTRVNQSLPSS